MRSRAGRRGVKRWLRYQYTRLLRQNDEPEKIAAGLALGVALGILPTFGLGVLIAIFVSGALRVNRVSAVVGTLVMNPWTAPFFWALSYLCGSMVMGDNLAETVGIVKSLRSHSDLWESLLARKLILPYAIGNALITLAASGFFYMAGLYGIRAYRKAKRRVHERRLRRHPGG